MDYNNVTTTVTVHPENVNASVWMDTSISTLKGAGTKTKGSKAALVNN